METRRFNGNIGLMLFGLFLAAMFAYRLWRHEYAFFVGGFEPGWEYTVVPFLMGVWFLVYGLIGHLRCKPK